MSTHARFRAVAALAAIAVAAGLGLGRPAAEQATTAAITAADLERRLRAFAHDSMEGRALASPGLVRATQYIAGELRRLGLDALGDGGAFTSEVPLEVEQIDVASAALALRMSGGARFGFKPGVDFIPVAGFRRSGVARSRTTVSTNGGRLGARDALLPESLTVEHAVALFAPMGADGTPEAAFWDPPGRIARYHRAHSLVVGALDMMPREMRARLAGPRYAIVPQQPRLDTLVPRATPLDTFPSVFAATSSVAQLMMRFADSTNVDAWFSVRFTRPEVRSHNVIAMVPGRDQLLRSQIIVVSAHADHAGIADLVDREGSDSVLNGANVGGSGAMALLEIAEHLMSVEARPRRSVILLWAVGAEHKSIGASWFTANLPAGIPQRAVVAHLSVDMLGRPAAEGGAAIVSVIGSRDVSMDLAGWLRELSARPAFGVQGDYRVDDGPLSERFRCATIHTHFARRGIPTAVIAAGRGDDRGRVADDANAIDYALYERTTRFVAGVVLDIANNEMRPQADPAPAFARLRCPWTP